MFEDTSEATLRCSSISLEDGADEASLNGEPIGLYDQGACFPSRWEFAPGAALELTLEIAGTGNRCKAQGIVVGCEPAHDRMWNITVLFLDPPTGLGNLRTTVTETPRHLLA